MIEKIQSNLTQNKNQQNIIENYNFTEVIWSAFLPSNGDPSWEIKNIISNIRALSPIL